MTPPGYVEDDTDCDDADADAWPGAAEIWYDGQDEGCDGGSDYDADGDGQDSATYGGEDCDFGFRLLEAGFGVYLAPDALVAHQGTGWRSPRYLDPVANWRYYYVFRNQWVIASRHRGLIGMTRSMACRVRTLGGCLYRMVCEVGRGNPGAARMAAFGIRDALLGRMGKGVPLPGDPASVR